MKSEQSPNRLEQNQKRPKLELKPVKRYEHLTGFDASNSDPCFGPPGLGATYASRGTPFGRLSIPRRQPQLAFRNPPKLLAEKRSHNENDDWVQIAEEGIPHVIDARNAQNGNHVK